VDGPLGENDGHQQIPVLKKPVHLNDLKSAVFDLIGN